MNLVLKPLSQHLNYLISSLVFHLSIKRNQNLSLLLAGKQSEQVRPPLPRPSFHLLSYDLTLLQELGKEEIRAVFRDVTL